MDAFTVFLNKMGLDPRVFGLGNVHGTPQPQELETFFSMVAVQPAPTSTEKAMADPSFDDIDVDGPIIEEFDDDDVDYEAEDPDKASQSVKDCQACPESWICEHATDPEAPCPLEMPSQLALPMSGFSSPPVFTQPLPAFLTNPAASAANGDSCAPSFQGDEEPESVNV